MMPSPVSGTKNWLNCLRNAANSYCLSLWYDIIESFIQTEKMMKVLEYKRFWIVAYADGIIDMVNKKTGRWRQVKSSQAGKWRSTHYQTKLNRVTF
jgi:hypothetical protein